MKPLATNQQVLTWLNVCPAEATATKREKNLYVALSVTVSFSGICFLTGSVLFLRNNWAINLEKAFFASVQIIVILSLIYMIIVVHTLHQKITKIFENLREIYDARKSSFPF